MLRLVFFLTFLAFAIAARKPHKLRSSSVANVCEFCSGGTSCAPGLVCKHSTCERVARGSPRCAPPERCGYGKRRVCRTYRSTDRNEFGQLKAEKAARGFFIGHTFMVRRCNLGLKKFKCERKVNVCRHNFCITFTLKECAAKGLVTGSINEGNQFTPCCVFVLPRDCYAEQLCRCLTREH